MKKIIKVNSREDILNFGDIWINEPHKIRVVGRYNGLYYLKNDTYPKYFKYEEPYDAHCCGTWREITEEDYNNYIKKEINKYKNKLNKLNANYLEKEIAKYENKINELEENL